MPYRELFSIPGAKVFMLTGFIARLPMGMVAIGMITMLSQLRGSFSFASTVSATFVLTSAVIAPQVSRLVDLHGQNRVLPVAATVSAAALLALSGLTYWHAPNWTLFAFAALAGCMPSMPAMVRARWSVLLNGAPVLRTAYAFESVLDEACFIMGPPMAVSLSVVVFAQAGSLAAAVLLVCGVLAFVAQRCGGPQTVQGTRVDGAQASLMRSTDVWSLVLVMVSLGAITGSVDVFSVAFATRSGEPASAGIALCAYATGSCLAGLCFGSLPRQMPLPRLLLAGASGTALMTLPILWVSSMPALAGVLLGTGVFVSPTMIVSMMLAERAVPAGRLTEALTWLITGLNIGIAAGAVCAGWIVDRYGAVSGFGVALGAGLLTVITAGHAFRRRTGSV